MLPWLLVSRTPTFAPRGDRHVFWRTFVSILQVIPYPSLVVGQAPPVQLRSLPGAHVASARKQHISSLSIHGCEGGLANWGLGPGSWTSLGGFLHTYILQSTQDAHRRYCYGERGRNRPSQRRIQPPVHPCVPLCSVQDAVAPTPLPLLPLLLGPHSLSTKPGASPAVPTVWSLSRSCPVSYSVFVLYQAGSWCYWAGNMSSQTFTYSTVNFGEPEPLANKQSTILGVVISFMVRSRRSPSKARLCSCLTMP